jgi:hypothetical protein
MTVINQPRAGIRADQGGEWRRQLPVGYRQSANLIEELLRILLRLLAEDDRVADHMGKMAIHSAAQENLEQLR